MEVLIVERTGGCGLALRRLLAERATGGVTPRVVEVPSADDVLLHLTPQRAAFVLLVAHDLAAALREVRQIAQNGAGIPLAVLVPGETVAIWRGSSRWLPWQTAVRQAGAVDVACSLVELPRVADTIARWQTQVPSASIGLRETVWNRLPWNNNAS